VLDVTGRLMQTKYKKGGGLKAVPSLNWTNQRGTVEEKRPHQVCSAHQQRGRGTVDKAKEKVEPRAGAGSLTTGRRSREDWAWNSAGPRGNGGRWPPTGTETPTRLLAPSCKTKRGKRKVYNAKKGSDVSYKGETQS